MQLIEELPFGLAICAANGETATLTGLSDRQMRLRTHGAEPLSSLAVRFLTDDRASYVACPVDGWRVSHEERTRLGVLRMVDKGEQDEKILGVPTDKVDPTYANIRDLADLPEIERQRIEAFFRIYKDLPAGRNTVELHGWGDAAEARRIIADAMARHASARAKGKP